MEWLKRFWPIVAILCICVVTVVIGGDSGDIVEYRAMDGWGTGKFLSSVLAGAPPSLDAVSTNNGIFVAWIEEDGSRVMVTSSADGGSTWSGPMAVEIPEEVIPSGLNYVDLFEDSSGTVWMAWSARSRARFRNGGVPSQIWVCTSKPGVGDTDWSTPRQVTRTEDWYMEGGELRVQYDCYRPVFAEWEGAVWVHWISNKKYQEGWIWRAGTTDEGDSWSDPVLLEGSPYYQSFYQASDASVWISGTATVPQSVWICVSRDFGYEWSDTEFLGLGAFPKISQAEDLIWVTWQSNRFSPTAKHKAAGGVDGQPYVWETQTEDVWFSYRLLSSGEWLEEAKLLEADSHENSGIVLETHNEMILLVYVTSEGLSDQYGDPPSQWRIKTTNNPLPIEPISTNKYIERKVQ